MYSCDEESAMNNPDIDARKLIDAEGKKRAKKRQLPIRLAVPNSKTVEAMTELDGGGGKRFATVEALMADMENDKE
jgi:hypothetical protein